MVVKSAARTLDILELFDKEKRSLDASAVASRLQWPVSSTSALLRTLVSRGYLDYDRSSRDYSPTIKVAILGDWLTGSKIARENLGALMQQIGRATGETVVAAIQSGINVEYVRVLDGTRPIRYHLENGTLRPMFLSGTGRMLLTVMRHEQIIKLLRWHNHVAQEKDRLSEEQVIKRAADDRRKGYVVSLEQFIPESGLIGILMPSVGDGNNIAIGVSGLSRRLVENELKYVNALREGAKYWSSLTEQEKS